MKEKRFKKKALSVFGIALVLAIGVGLLTVFATSSAAAQVSVAEEEGIKISTVNTNPSIDPVHGFGRAYQSVGEDIFRVDPDPTGEDESVDFRITITQHSALNDLMLKLTIDNEGDFTMANVYKEENSIGDLTNGDNTFYVNPSSGSTTLYVELTDDGSDGVNDNIVISLDSVSWAKNPFNIGRKDGDSLDIVASGKALE